jgi:hypothetical protein
MSEWNEWPKSDRGDIIRMAREANIGTYINLDSHLVGNHLEHFANLVAAAERERIKWDTIHSCHPECDKPVCVAIRKAVLEEREACVEEIRYYLAHSLTAKDILDAIRKRGAP